MEKGKINVLSLFDGMACGMLAFKSLGIQVENYYAYEIDKYAVQTATHNFPDIQELGDVFNADFSQHNDIDWLVGGSPCTYWSIAQSPDKRETTASGMGWELFSRYVRALNEAKPKFFLYENNKSMSKAIYQSISETFGFEPICINSALVSAQNRQRLYWVGKRNADGTYSRVDIQQPKDKGILLKDVLDGIALKDKQNCIDANYYKGGNYSNPNKQSGQRMCAAEPVGIAKDGKSFCLTARYYKGVGNNPGIIFDKHRDSMAAEPVGMAQRGRYNGNGTEQHFEAREDGKSNCVTTVQKDYMVGEPVMYDVPHGFNNGGVFSKDKSPTLTSACWQENHKIIEPVNTTFDGKSQTIKAQYSNTDVNNICKYTSTYGASGVAEPVGCVQVGAMPRPTGELSKSQGFRIYETNAKSVSLKSCAGGAGGKTGLYAIPVEYSGDIPIKAMSCADGKTYKVYQVVDGQIVIKEKKYPIKLQDGYYIIRKLTISECKRLQTVPDWYEFPVSDSQAYKMLGNGWTVEVIAHLISSTIHESKARSQDENET